MVGGVRVERDVPAIMRDGTALYADIYRPLGEGPFPVLLMRQPYDKTLAMTFTYHHPSWYASQGYMVVSQDTRGRWRSEGEFYPFRHETEDGYDTVQWAAHLPGSSGAVGMYGYSYEGMTQIYAAIARPPNLTCICPGFLPAECYEGFIYRGGALSLAFALTWSLYFAREGARHRGEYALENTIDVALQHPSRLFLQQPYDETPAVSWKDVAPYFHDWISHPCRDEYWESMSYNAQIGSIQVPALHIGGWHDSFIDGTIQNFQKIRSSAGGIGNASVQHLLVGPWYHNPWSPTVGTLNFGIEARSRINEAQIKWFDHWLKGISNGVADEPSVRYFVTGDEHWEMDAVWPPAASREVLFYLHSEGTAHTRWGTGTLNLKPPEREPADVYVYDPRAFIPSIGGHSCCIPAVTPMGPADQRPVEEIQQVLVYRSDLLKEGLTVTGPVTLVLYAASSALDTDFTAKFVDEHPDGRCINIAEGIIRARFRDSLSSPAPLKPGKVYKLAINLNQVAHTFKSGHRLVVEVSSSNFPLWDRNTNSGGVPALEGYRSMIVATQQVFHEAPYQSALVVRVRERAV
jgi:hypothetical protein